MRRIQKLSPGRIISGGFLCVILIGSLLLMLPFAVNPGESIGYVDALFTATSAACVTGMVVVDTADTFSVFGRTVIAVLIQIGGLGVASIGVAIITAMGRKVNLKERLLIKEALNLNSGGGMVGLVKDIIKVTLLFEGIGAVLSFFVFVRDYPPVEALGISIFHSVASFNNAGFDILGGFKSLVDYKGDVLLNLVTAGLIIIGGLGFLVLRDCYKKRSFFRLTFHSKVVLVTTAVLLAVGTLCIRLTENITWLGAFFASVTTRTAGFATFSFGDFTKAGLITSIFLMFIGASPGSTGGGIKTTTVFTLFHTLKGVATNQPGQAFHYRIAHESFFKASVVTMLSGLVVCAGTFFMSILEPAIPAEDILFEVVSSFGTVGLSTGVTTQLHTPALVLEIFIMFIGRVGPLTIASLWVFKKERLASYPEGDIAIG